jgi:hypothetical protein
MLSKPPISPEKKIAPVDEIDEEEEEDEDLIGGKDINLNRVSITLKFFEKAGGNVTAKFYSVFCIVCGFLFLNAFFCF